MSLDNPLSFTLPIDSDDQTKTPNIESLWYKPDVGSRLKPAIQAVFEHWSDIAGDELTHHLHHVRDKAWQHFRYPCIGEWIFLLPIMTQMSVWPDILKRARADGTVLDLGCCFGQNLRLLAANGVETTNMYAMDITSEFWDLGFDLFRDDSKMKATFIRRDILEPSLRLEPLDGKMDIILACLFLHLFSREQQILATKRIIQFSRPGSMVIGYQRAHPQTYTVIRPGYVMYLHNLDTFRDLWRQVEAETGTKWQLKVEMVEIEEWGLEKEDHKWIPWAGINFVATRES